MNDKERRESLLQYIEKSAAEDALRDDQERLQGRVDALKAQADEEIRTAGEAAAETCAELQESRRELKKIEHILDSYDMSGLDLPDVAVTKMKRGRFVIRPGKYMIDSRK